MITNLSLFSLARIKMDLFLYSLNALLVFGLLEINNIHNNNSKNLIDDAFVCFSNRAF